MPSHHFHFTSVAFHVTVYKRQRASLEFRFAKTVDSKCCIELEIESVLFVNDDYIDALKHGR